jgi:(S)-ureidoglycine aminohydrolase
MKNLGQTRSSYQRTHLLQTPDTFVRAPLPGMKAANAVVHTGPALGAGFTQYSAEFESGGELGPALGERFLYVIEGAITVRKGKKSELLAAGDYAHVPEGTSHRVIASEKSRAAVIEKKYVAMPEVDPGSALFGRENAITAVALLGDPDLEVRQLLPEKAGYDYAVNTMLFRPGAALSMVEIHVMEHGLLMLEGGGIYRLNDNWYSVTAGDFIWMAPYCPQWFAAVGKRPAKYLIYKDWNRHPFSRSATPTSRGGNDTANRSRTAGS